MNDHKEDFGKAMKSWMAEKGKEQQPMSGDELSSLELADEETRNRLLERMALDDGALEGFAAFNQVSDDQLDSIISDDEVSTSWQDMQQKLAEQGIEEPVSTEHRPVSQSPAPVVPMKPRRFGESLLGFAAGFLLAAVGAAIWFQEPKTEPFALTPFVETDLAASNRNEPRVQLVLDDTGLVLNLFWIVADYDEMMFRVLDDQGRIIATRSLPPEDGRRALLLAQHDFPGPGVYNIQFYDNRQPADLIRDIRVDVRSPTKK